MKKNRTALNIMLILEAVILIVVLVFAALSGAAGRTGGNSSSGEEAETSTEGGVQGVIKEEDAKESTEDSSETSEEDAEETEVSDAYEEDRIEFSEEVEDLLSEMSEEELVAQLFVTTPEELTGVDAVTIAGEGTRSSLDTYPVAGLVYSSANFADASQIKELLSGTQSYSQEITGLDMFLIVEELGGSASPVAEAAGYDVQESPSALGETGSTDSVSEAASARASYLSEAGFTMVLGPIADTSAGSDDDFDALTYGSSALDIADYVAADVSALQSGGLLSALQAFPGVQSAEEDYSAYQSAIDAGVACIQVSGIADSSVTGSDSLPCTLSAGATETLRGTMGFTGLLMTADLGGESVTSYCGSAEAAVEAVKAGMNLLYVSDGFEDCYSAVLEAVQSGEITETQLQNAAGRILTEKLS